MEKSRTYQSGTLPMLKKWTPGLLTPKADADKSKEGALIKNANTGKEIEAFQIGNAPWAKSDIEGSIDGFMQLYKERPIKNTEGGLSSIGMFSLWTILRKIQPSQVIQCGVYNGQTTWLMEKILPHASILAIDPDPDQKLFKSPTVEYITSGFLEADLPVKYLKKNTCVFFDDHGDAFKSISKCQELGLKYLIFDDNYPEQKGNRHRSVGSILGEKKSHNKDWSPEKRVLLEWLDEYAVFPPLFEWSQPITQELTIIMNPSLLGKFDAVGKKNYLELYQGMQGYRWPTYLKLK
jgi:hypothetical protein